MSYDRIKNTEAVRKYRKRHPARVRRQSQNVPSHGSAYRTAKRLENYEAYIATEQAYRETNRERINTLMNQRRRALKKQCLEYLGGARCCRCGLEHENVVIYDFHHLDPSKKESGISAWISRGVSFTKIRPELHKCVIMCRNCHTIEHSEPIERSRCSEEEVVYLFTN